MDAATERRGGVAWSSPAILIVGPAITESLGAAKSLTRAIVIFAIEAAGIFVPLAALFGLPALAVVWFARKRKRLTPTLIA